MYGLNKMYLMMQKQVNRGQDGAGLANVKIDVEPGKRYISRHRSNSNKAIQDIFDKVNDRYAQAQKEHPESFMDANWRKDNLPFSGEVFLGHLRYGTFGGNNIEQCHPFLRQNNWKNRNLILAGNFNMTNVDQLFDELIELGQHPKQKADTVTILEKIGHFLDEENERLYRQFKKQGHDKRQATDLIGENLDIQRILKKSSKHWDGGFAMAGMIGNGDAFVLRDPAAIRPAYYYKDDEVVVVASERPVIQTVFNVPFEEVKEIERGAALIIQKNGEVSEKAVMKRLPRKACSFERIYFSRAGDAEIYRERIRLGQFVCKEVFKTIDHELEDSVLSFIPNSAEVSFYGMIKGFEDALNVQKKEQIFKEKKNLSKTKLQEILNQRIRVEKVAIKDAKLRTFITNDNSRDDLVAHVYDITYGTVQPTDNLVVIDDSIVRGTTLKQSIIKILDRLNPKRIVIVSSAPQIRYPDCYGIDMAKMGDFIAFRAAIELLKETKQDHIIDEVYQKSLKQRDLPDNEVVNYVKEIYRPFTPEQISAKIAELVTPKNINAEVKIVFQTIEDLHKACPNHKGDWYFTGDYPTPGGSRVVNKAFINFVEGINERAY